MKPRVLLAEDDDEIRYALREMLEDHGFEVLCAKNGNEIADILHVCEMSKRRPDCIITDYRMPNFTGLDVLLALRKLEWATPVVLITAFSFGSDIPEQARALGAFEVVKKPFESRDLIGIIKRACSPH